MHNTDTMVYIDLAQQSLRVEKNQNVLFSTLISSSLNGAGEQYGSEMTPRGWHVIRAKIGANEPINTVFSGRRKTNELYSSELAKQFPERDWILTRILWLSGIEPGFNRLGVVDTMRRYIYIHGCPDENNMGQNNSHGCIRMNNLDVIKLFDLVEVGNTVLISE